MAKPHYLSASGEEWQKARTLALARDNFTCQAHQLGLCNEPCTENRLRKLQVHHLKMRIHGGTHDLDNLLTLCHRHHVDVHPHMRFQVSDFRKEVDYEPPSFTTEADSIWPDRTL